jgi:hypothetical protein
MSKTFVSCAFSKETNSCSSVGIQELGTGGNDNANSENRIDDRVGVCACPCDQSEEIKKYNQARSRAVTIFQWEFSLKS